MEAESQLTFVHREQKTPAQLKTVCGNNANKVESEISNTCGSNAQSAMKYFASKCSSAGYKLGTFLRPY